MALEVNNCSLNRCQGLALPQECDYTKMGGVSRLSSDKLGGECSCFKMTLCVHDPPLAISYHSIGQIPSLEC